MPRIKELFAWTIADKDDDDEGVIGINTPHGWMPLVGADMERAKCLRSAATAMARLANKPVKLIRSTGIEVVEVVEP